jgi:acetyl-CoA carboxylase biotin carboxylase subunit
MVYGVDLVREQLRIARGMPMAVGEWPLAPRGHAIECRITSEDPGNGFLPSTGRIGYLRVPSGPGVRWDAGVETGDEVTLHYDSLLGKLIVRDENRTLALARLTRALDELVISGVTTNQGFHRRLLGDPAFRRGEVDIQFLERRGDLLGTAEDAVRDRRVAIAAALAEDAARREGKPALARDGDGDSAWARAGRRDALR